MTRFFNLSIQLLVDVLTLPVPSRVSSPVPKKISPKATKPLISASSHKRRPIRELEQDDDDTQASKLPSYIPSLPKNRPKSLSKRKSIEVRDDTDVIEDDEFEEENLGW